MAQVVRQSPYTAPGTGPDGVDPDRLAGSLAYAVPDPLDSAKDARVRGWDGTGSATTLHESPTGVPDASRLRHTPLHSTTPTEGDPVRWWHRYTRDLLGRHSVEYQDADGNEVAPKENPRFAARPRPSDAGETRPTMKMNPHSYIFTRPWQQDMARTFNGVHFSMADHRRTYPVLGMEPPRKIRRNTFRIEPEPWDTDLVDMPPTVDSSPDTVVTVVDVPMPVTRSWRL